MPQTIEAIQHAKAAKVPLIVAVNKIDVEGAEREVIGGADRLLSSEHAPVVCFEHGHAPVGMGSVFDALAAHGYEFLRFPIGQYADGPLTALDGEPWAHTGENVVAIPPNFARERLTD